MKKDQTSTDSEAFVKIKRVMTVLSFMPAVFLLVMMVANSFVGTKEDYGFSFLGNSQDLVISGIALLIYLFFSRVTLVLPLIIFFYACRYIAWGIKYGNKKVIFYLPASLYILLSFLPLVLFGFPESYLKVAYFYSILAILAYLALVLWGHVEE